MLCPVRFDIGLRRKALDMDDLSLFRHQCHNLISDFLEHYDDAESDLRSNKELHPHDIQVAKDKQEMFSKSVKFLNKFLSESEIDIDTAKEEISVLANKMRVKQLTWNWESRNHKSHSEASIIKRSRSLIAEYIAEGLESIR